MNAIARLLLAFLPHNSRTVTRFAETSRRATAWFRGAPSTEGPWIWAVLGLVRTRSRTNPAQWLVLSPTSADGFGPFHSI